MFGRKVNLEWRVQQLEERIEELSDPEYAEGKAILRDQCLANKADPNRTLGDDYHWRHMIPEGKARVARRVADYYLKLAEKYSGLEPPTVEGGGV